MDWLSGVPESIWQLPIQVLVIVLLSLGVFVTKREHSNMTKMMEYFRDTATNKDATISNQAEALNELKNEIVPLLKDFIKSVRSIVHEKRDDV